MKPRVIIPKSPLGEALSDAAQLRREAAALLAELEASYTKTPPTKPGGWRHDPLGWMKRFRR